AVKRGHEELLAASQEFAQRLYQQSAQSQQQEGAAGGGTAGPGAGPSSAPSDDEVADAEIVDEDDRGGEQKGSCPCPTSGSPPTTVARSRSPRRRPRRRSSRPTWRVCPRSRRGETSSARRSGGCEPSSTTT